MMQRRARAVHGVQTRRLRNNLLLLQWIRGQRVSLIRPCMCTLNRRSSLYVNRRRHQRQ